jgi:hypothetical protein
MKRCASLQLCYDVDKHILATNCYGPGLHTTEKSGLAVVSIGGVRTANDPASTYLRGHDGGDSLPAPRSSSEVRDKPSD